MTLTMWDSDVDVRSPIPFDLIDEFVFNFTEPAGAEYKTFDIPGVRPDPKSK